METEKESMLILISIDIPITTSHGVTMAVVDQSLITSIWNGLSVFTESCEQIDLAFIAV